MSITPISSGSVPPPVTAPQQTTATMRERERERDGNSRDTAATPTPDTTTPPPDRSGRGQIIDITT